MVNRDQLRRTGLRAYEVGRARTAARAAWVLTPLVLLCALETGTTEACACVGALLLGAVVFLRWKNRRSADAARDGLLAGLPPLVGALLVARFAPLSAWSVAALFAVAVAPGLWLGTRPARTASMWLAAVGVAIATACLGGVALGPIALLAAAAGLVVGAASTRNRAGATP